MFSGIVETMGTIEEITAVHHCFNMRVTPHIAINDFIVGESIAINGVCLTVTQYTPTVFNVTLVPETYSITTFPHLKIKSEVNLERARRLTDRLGGHYVQGHVDGIGQIIEIQTPCLRTMQEDEYKEVGKEVDRPKISDFSQSLEYHAIQVKIALPETLTRYVVKKGYITIDGMSLTVIDVSRDELIVTLIPHTQHSTIARQYQCGTRVNIEVDMIAKYIEKFLKVRG